jgi:Co/Zn/Cd efflux system component
MSDCGCETKTESPGQRRVLSIALGLNASMFVIGLVAGLIAQSSGLIADSLDMFADAVAYGIALSAFNRGTAYKARAATVSGGVLLTLGIGVLLDSIRRGVFGSSPESRVMMGVASISLLVNATVLYLLGTYRDQGVHLRATWIFTRVDVIANLAVILSGLTILLTRFRFIDLIVGAAIGLYVIKEGLEIISEAREAGEKALRLPDAEDEQH